MDTTALKEQVLKLVIEYKHGIGAFEMDSVHDYDAHVNDLQQLLMQKIEYTTNAMISKTGYFDANEYQKLLDEAEKVLKENQVRLTVPQFS